MSQPVVNSVHIATNPGPAPQGPQERFRLERRGAAGAPVGAGAPGAGGNPGNPQRINVHGTWYELRFTQIDPENGDRNIAYDNATMGNIAEQVRQLALAQMSPEEAKNSRSFRTLLSRTAPRGNLLDAPYVVKFSRRAMNQPNYVDVSLKVSNLADQLRDLFVEAERVRGGGKVAKREKKSRSKPRLPQPQSGQGNAEQPAPSPSDERSLGLPKDEAARQAKIRRQLGDVDLILPPPARSSEASSNLGDPNDLP